MQGRGLNERVTVVSVVYKPFYVREIFTFFLRVLSMYLTDTTVTFPVFRAFLHFLVTVEDSKSRLQGKDETTIRIAWLFLPVFVAACEGFCSKSRPFQRTPQSA